MLHLFVIIKPVFSYTIGLSGLVILFFNQTFSQSAAILSQFNIDFRNKADSFLTRSEFRARGDAS
ncbi:hypothetical protein BDF21DRAFT_434661 [Thamnidium elegans]|nr:hypothetical protein BDF21DRAFT_434661 [Thamnidium elegans]